MTREAETKKSWRLFPYTAIDGIPTMTDSCVMSIFDKMEKEKIAETVFIEGQITNKYDFLRMMKFTKTKLFVLKNKKQEIGGVFWLNNLGITKAEFHFCLFSDISAKERVVISTDVVCMLLEWKNDKKYLFDMLYGYIPESNKAARLWARKMKFELLGLLPCAVFNSRLKISEAAEFFYVERGKYNVKTQ